MAAASLWSMRTVQTRPVPAVGPADWVTLTRASIAAVIAVLVVSPPVHVALLVSLSATALVLDAVDGWVARRTWTTARGARLDGEVDAFLILVLSVYVARDAGAWVLAIGLARYVFLAAGWVLPWMRAPLPPRHWRKVVCATQGVVLTIAAADVLPPAWTRVLLLGALALLAESFGRDVVWLSRRRRDAQRPTPAGVAVALSALALLIVWAALVAPHEPGHFTLGAFARLPLELLVLVALAALLPATPRRVLAVVAGVLLGVLVIVKVLDVGFFTAFDRPFNPVDDWSYTSIGIETLRSAIGRSHANLAIAVTIALAVVILIVPVTAMLRVTRVAARHRGWALQAAVALGVVWMALRVLGAPAASAGA